MPWHYTKYEDIDDCNSTCSRGAKHSECAKVPQEWNGCVSFMGRHDTC